MSVIQCIVTCPYCHDRQIIETTQVPSHLDFVNDLHNEEVGIDDIVTRCIKCDKRFVVSTDLTIDVYEFALVGEATKPTPETVEDEESP